MPLKSLFKNAAQSVIRFVDHKKIRIAESCKADAEAGYGYMATCGSVVKIRLTPEQAQRTVEACNHRLAILYERNPDMAPKPSR